MKELAWHLFTWGQAVEIVSPPRLRALLVEQLQAALDQHTPLTDSGAGV